MCAAVLAWGCGDTGECSATGIQGPNPREYWGLALLARDEQLGCVEIGDASGARHVYFFM